MHAQIDQKRSHLVFEPQQKFLAYLNSVFGGAENNTRLYGLVLNPKMLPCRLLGAVTLLSVTHKGSKPSSKKNKGSEPCFDIHESLNGHRIQNVIGKIEFFSFNPEIVVARKEFLP